MLYFVFSVALFGLTIFELTTLFKKLPVLQMLPYCIMILIGIQCIAFGMLSFFGVGFNGLINAAVEACVCIFCILFKRKNAQKLVVDEGDSQGSSLSRMTRIIHRLGSRGDMAATLFNLLFVIAFSLLHFGPELNLAFLSDDSAAHFSSIVRYAEGVPVTAQFSFGLFGACVLDAVRCLIDSAHYYQCYVFTEIFWWWLSMQMFYALIRRTATQLTAPLAILLCALYTFGYPLYSLNLGFGYYGASIAITCAIFFTTACLPLREPINLIALSALLTELAVGYLLFVPPVFFIAFIAVMFTDETWKANVLKCVGISALVLIIPCFFALFLSYTGFFFSGSTTTVSQSINSFTDGVSRDANTLKVLYADFIFIAPLAIYGFAAKVAKRGSFLSVGLFSSIFTLYCLALFVFCLLGVISPYYYYKAYAILWMVFFICTALGVEQLLPNSKRLMISYGCVWLTIIALAVTGLDERLSAKRPNLDSTPISDQLFPLYKFNADLSRPPIFDPETLAQIREHEDESLSEDRIAVLSGQNEKRWIQSLGFDGICIPWQTNHDGTTYDAQTILESMEDSDYVYIDDTFYGRPVSSTDYSALDEVTEYIIANSDELFETDHGTMYRLHEDAA